MRKPARNGNPGALDPNLAQQRRHFLRGRWRDPSLEEDERFLRIVMSTLPHQQVALASELLTEFSRLVAAPKHTFLHRSVRLAIWPCGWIWCDFTRLITLPTASRSRVQLMSTAPILAKLQLTFPVCSWKPGPAGRGGERLSKKRTCPSEGGDSSADYGAGDGDGDGDASPHSPACVDVHSDSFVIGGGGGGGGGSPHTSDNAVASPGSPSWRESRAPPSRPPVSAACSP